MSCLPLSGCIIIPLFDEVSDSQFNLLWIFKLGICDWWSEIRKMDESTLACCHKKLKLIFKWREFNRLHDLGFSVVYLISEVFFHHLLFLLHISPCLSEIYSILIWHSYIGLVNAWTEYICYMLTHNFILLLLMNVSAVIVLYLFFFLKYIVYCTSEEKMMSVLSMQHQEKRVTPIDTLDVYRTTGYCVFDYHQLYLSEGFTSLCQSL